MQQKKILNPEERECFDSSENAKIARKPVWLRRKLPAGPAYGEVRGLLKSSRLNTVCREADCPNRWECYSNKTAAFLIMGSKCTRNCRFCAVEHGPIEPPDPDEPARVAQAAEELGLKYVVVTSVTRDDLPDGGAECFAETIRNIRERLPDALVEVLIPDFKGDPEALQTVLRARPDVLNHNIETVRRLYPTVRPEADYRRSLDLFRNVSQFDSSIPTKSGLMLGLGEKKAEILDTFSDLLEAGCRILTLGQYLQPSRSHLPVQRFATPAEFDELGKTAREMGFKEVSSGPLVRSSYQAKKLYDLL